MTSEFAVASIRHGWKQFGSMRYPKANHLLIEADAGGCNTYADRFYKALVNRCRRLPIGQAADKIRWFPPEPIEWR